MIGHLKRRVFKYKEDIQMSKLPDTEDIMEKINELVDAVNRLKETVNNSTFEEESQTNLIYTVPFKLGMEDGFKVALENLDENIRGVKKSKRPYISTPYGKSLWRKVSI